MSVQVCQVPIVFPPAQHAVAYSEVADALACLDNLVDFVFSGITKKIQLEKDRLTCLASRIDAAQVKTQSLVANRSAITVYSAAKYPSLNWQDSTPVFSEVKGHVVPHHSHIQFPKSKDELEPLEKGFREEAEALMLVKPNTPESKPIPTGLGPLPKRPEVQSVDSLLLFNSTENVYRKYVPGDNLARSMEKMKQKQKVKLDVLPQPPISVLNSESLARQGKQDLRWIPGPVDVPDLDVVNNLPLSNIATDTQWTGKFLPIGPSDNVPPPIPFYELPDPVLLNSEEGSRPNSVSFVPTPDPLRKAESTPPSRESNPTLQAPAPIRAEPASTPIPQPTIPTLQPRQQDDPKPTIAPSPVKERVSETTVAKEAPVAAVSTPDVTSVPVSIKVDRVIPPPRPSGFLEQIEHGVILKPVDPNSKQSTGNNFLAFLRERVRPEEELDDSDTDSDGDPEKWMA